MRFFPGIGHSIESVAWHIGTSCVRNRGRQSANMQSMKLLSVQKQNIPTEMARNMKNENFSKCGPESATLEIVVCMNTLYLCRVVLRLRRPRRFPRCRSFPARRRLPVRYYCRRRFRRFLLHFPPEKKLVSSFLT